MQGTVKICFFNEMNHNPGKEVYDHHHGCYELVYYHTGNGTVRMGGGIIPYRSGSFCLIPPMCSHAEYHSAPCRLSFIGFITGDDLRSVCGMHTDTEDMFFARQMKDFFNEQRRKAYGYEMLMQDAVRKMFIYLLRAKETETKNVPDRMLYAVNYLNEYYNDRIDMKQLASMCGYGYDYFHHLFRERTGMSPTEYLKRRRLASAAKLLREGVSCTDAAYRCGFSGSAHFSRVFRKQYGFPPSEIHLHRFDAAADEYFGESSHHEAK